MEKTLRVFLEELGSYCYDHGDYNVIKNTNKAEEVKNFVDCYIKGAEVIKNGENGQPLFVKGKANEDKGSTGDEKLFFHGYQLYDMTGQTGEWVIATFPSKAELEKHILSEGGYLNIYCTEMLVFLDGVLQPFEVQFFGDNQKYISIDKDLFDEELDIKGMQDRISVKWLPIETEEEVVAAH